MSPSPTTSTFRLGYPMPESFKKERIDRRAAKASEADSIFPGLLEAAPDAMVVVDQDGRIVLVNSQTEKLFGYHREELLGQDVEVLVPEHLRKRHRFHRMNFLAKRKSGNALASGENFTTTSTKD